tara:strand:+ start:19935 stop:20381 length:447 start_codon:yes stop_codon:yes gene_type:complete
MIRWVIFIVLIGIADFYAFQSLRTITKSNLWYAFYWLFTLVIVGNFIIQFYSFSRSNGFSQSNSLAVGLLIALVVPKLLVIAIMFGEDVLRLPQGLYSYFMQDSGSSTTIKHVPERRKFISKIALGVAAVPFYLYFMVCIKGSIILRF